MNHRHIGAARLLRCFAHNAPPPFRAFLRCLRKVLFRSSRDDRRDRRHAKFGGFFDGPLHAIELVDGHHQSNRQGGVGIEFGNKVKPNFAGFSRLGHRGDLGVKDPSTGNNIRLHPRFSAQHARQMFSLRTLDRGSCFVPVFGNPAAARHRARPLFI